MADSPRNRRRPRVAGSRKRKTTDDTANSENRSVEISGSQEEPAEVQSSDADLAEDAPAEDTAAEAGGGEGGQDSSPATDSAESDAEVAADSTPAEAPETDTRRDTDPDSDSDAGVTADTGSGDAGDAGSDDAATAAESEAASESRPGMRRWLLPVMAACTVVFAVLAVWFQYEVRSLNNDGPAANAALADSPATSEVNGQVSDAVEKLFSYDFADTAKTEKAAKNLLVDGATEEYNQLFSTVKEQAPKQKLVVTTTVKSSGVTNLQDDRAEVLLFVDQKAVRTDNGKNNVAPAQISVGAVKHGDQWKINKITQR